jgi:hypothetical protein
MLSFTAFVNGDCIRSPFFSVYGPIRSYTDTNIYDRNTITGIMAKHGRKRPFTKFVTFDLGINTGVLILNKKKIRIL